MIKDNSAYLIKEIKQATAKKIDELQKQHKKNLAELKKRLDKKDELALLEATLAKQREAYVVQQENMIALKKDHMQLLAVGELVQQVTNKVRAEMQKPALVKAILASFGKVKSFEVPKGIKMEHAVRSDNKIVATLSSGSVVEFDIDEFLDEHKGIIYKQVRDAL